MDSELYHRVSGDTSLPSDSEKSQKAKINSKYGEKIVDREMRSQYLGIFLVCRVFFTKTMYLDTVLCEILNINKIVTEITK